MKKVDQSFKAYFQSAENCTRNYSVITFKERVRLIEMVCTEKKQINHAAASLGIKISTAKYILWCFRKSGKILRKNNHKNEENKSYQNSLSELKAKIQETKRKKMRNHSNKLVKRRRIISKESFEETVKPKPPTRKQEIFLKKEEKQSPALETQPIQVSDLSMDGQQFFYVLYQPLWFNYMQMQAYN